MKKYIRKADIILFIVLVITGLAASAALTLSHSEAGGDAKVIIESGGRLYATYPLSEDRSVVVPAPKHTDSEDSSADSDDPDAKQHDHYNVIVISSGTVSVTEASCKNQVCVKHAVISRSGESIVCLPNRMMVRIDGGSEKGGGYDSVTS